MITRPTEVLPQPDHFCTALAVNMVDQDSVSLAGILRGSNWIVKKVRTCQEALDFLRKKPAPVLLCETQAPDGTWKTLLDALRELAGPPALIVVSNLADERLWAEVLNCGGYDVLVTPFERSELVRVLFLAWTTSNRKVEPTPAGLKHLPVRTAEGPGFKKLHASSGR